ncbi:hypothetical protein G7Y89_g2982 [Cudoniella acicularis]|uniref:Uncharacterized protein n=1 Tax=Cudoniella acicularis TaxID=354080 RepID=A0A8H4W841_9HELO|nr:hypothetical protein G7Y89_g2982 [Cudoniella acicularis]
MGSIVSKESRTRFMTPVETKEQLQAKFAHLLVREYRDWSEKQRIITVGFDELFATFAENREPTNGWSLSSFEAFFAHLLPADKRYIIKDASPILYRMVHRLGSYPYQLFPTGPLPAAFTTTAKSSEKSGQALSPAVVTKIILRNAVLIIMLPLFSKDSALKRQRVLFQSMAWRDSSLPSVSSRNDDEDEDLIHTLFMLSNDNFRRYHWNEAFVTSGPPLPPASTFPSSFSTDTRGVIPRGELGPLLRLLLIYQQTFIDIEEVLGEHEAGFDLITGCVLNSFFDYECSQQQSTDVSWGLFYSTLIVHLPNLFDSLEHLFEIFLRDHSLPQPAPKTNVFRQFLARTSEMIQPQDVPFFPKPASFELSEDSVSSMVEKKPVPPVFLTYSIICQLSSFFPQYLKIRLCNATPLGPSIFKECVINRSYAGILLIHGSLIRNLPLGSTARVTFGILFTASDTKIYAPNIYQYNRTYIFQLEPVHRIHFDTPLAPESEPIDTNFYCQNGKIAIKACLTTEKSESVTLEVNGTTQIGTFTRTNLVQVGDTINPGTQFLKSAEVYEKFRVESFKLLGLDR